MSAPIPRSLLIHSITIEPYTGMSRSSATYGEAIQLDRVRVEPVKQNAMTALGDAKADRFTLFIDYRNSLPPQTVPAVKDRITFEGQVLSVRTVTPCYGSEPSPHHYEVRLA